MREEVIISADDLSKLYEAELLKRYKSQFDDVLEAQTKRIAELQALLSHTSECYAECIATREDYRFRIAQLEAELEAANSVLDLWGIAFHDKYGKNYSLKQRLETIVIAKQE